MALTTHPFARLGAGVALAAVLLTACGGKSDAAQSEVWCDRLLHGSRPEGSWDQLTLASPWPVATASIERLE